MLDPWKALNEGHVVAIDEEDENRTFAVIMNGELRFHQSNMLEPEDWSFPAEGGEWRFPQDGAKYSICDGARFKFEC